MSTHFLNGYCFYVLEGEREINSLGNSEESIIVGVCMKVTSNYVETGSQVT